VIGIVETPPQKSAGWTARALNMERATSLPNLKTIDQMTSFYEVPSSRIQCFAAESMEPHDNLCFLGPFAHFVRFIEGKCWSQGTPPSQRTIGPFSVVAEFTTTPMISLISTMFLPLPSFSTRSNFHSLTSLKVLGLVFLGTGGDDAPCSRAPNWHAAHGR